MKYKEEDKLRESFKCGLCGSAVHEYLYHEQIKDIFGCEGCDDYFHACENEYCLNNFGVYDFDSEYIEEKTHQGVLGAALQTLLTQLEALDDSIDEDVYADYKVKRGNYHEISNKQSFYIRSKNADGAARNAGTLVEAHKEYTAAKKRLSGFGRNIEDRDKVIEAIALLRSI